MTKTTRVALVRCERYHAPSVKTAIEQGISLMGGISEFVAPGETILLKPNVLTGTAPENAVTTHPAVLKAVAEICLAAGACVTVGDSPGLGRPQQAFKKAGLWQVMDALNLDLADFETGTPKSFPEGHLIKQFTLANGVHAADGLFSLPKLKTHGLTKITGALKNQFGCIPGLLKGEFHFRLPNVEVFSKMLVDLTRCVRPRIYIMDGILGMEGNGPQGGTPKPMNVLLFSTDPIALDATVCRLIGLPPEYVVPIQLAEEAGLGTYHAEQIELVGDPIASFHVQNFDVNREPPRYSQSTGLRLPFLSPLVKTLLTPKPVIDPARCTRCGTCVRICPAQPKALAFPQGARTRPPEYNYTHCIRCYCCQEMCPESAITIHTPLLGRLLHK